MIETARDGAARVACMGVTGPGNDIAVKVVAAGTLGGR